MTGNLPSISFLYLTNSLGKIYTVSRDDILEHSGGQDFRNNLVAKVFRMDFEAYGVGGWDESFFIPQHIEPGDYRLWVTQIVCTFNLKYSWRLTSNFVDIRISK